MNICRPPKKTVRFKSSQKITIYFSLLIVLLTGKVAAQAPLSFNYQGVALTSAGATVVSKNL
jgi:hypothetical protein